MVMWLVTGGKTHREYKRSLDQFKVAATSSPCETLLHCSTRKAKRTITKNKKAKQNKTITIRKKVMVTTSKWNTTTSRKVYGCHSQRFLTFPWPFPDIFLTNVKFPWPTELTISQILVLIMDSTLPSQPSPSPIYLCFQQVTCHVHELIVPQHNMQKGLIFFETQHQQILIMSVKCTKEF